YVDTATAGHGFPWRTTGQLEQPVIVVESNEGRRGEGENFLRGRRPDGACHRQQVVVAERGTKTALRQIVAEADRLVTQQRRVACRAIVEPDKVAQQRPKARTQQIAGLSKQAREAGPGIFEIALVKRNRERHFR
ncbi:hypothetical protein CEE86_13330, partial [Lactobacillus crispatus]